LTGGIKLSKNFGGHVGVQKWKKKNKKPRCKMSPTRRLNGFADKTRKRRLEANLTCVA